MENQFLKWRAGNKYNLNKLIIIWRAKRARNFFLDFDVSNQHISEFELHYCQYWRQIIFFTVPLSKFIFFSQNQSKEIFFKNSPAPPPQNIKWTVPNSSCLSHGRPAYQFSLKDLTLLTSYFNFFADVSTLLILCFRFPPGFAESTYFIGQDAAILTFTSHDTPIFILQTLDQDQVKIIRFEAFGRLK